MFKKHFRFIALCCVLCPSLAIAQQKPHSLNGPGSIVGIVANEAGRLAAANVTLRASTDTTTLAQTISAFDGAFRFDGLPFGSYDLRVSYVGHPARDVRGIMVSLRAPVAEIGTINLGAHLIAQIKRPADTNPLAHR